MTLAFNHRRCPARQPLENDGLLPAPKAGFGQVPADGQKYFATG
jgi:hypothetical protein